LSNHSLKYRDTTCITSKGIENDIPVDIVTAIRGWAYKRKFFNSDFINDWEKAKNEYPFIFFNDDIWISGQLEKLQIPKIVVSDKIQASENLRLYDSSLIRSKGQGDKTSKHIQLFKKYWKPNITLNLSNNYEIY
jgi:hypothetical protein